MCWTVSPLIVQNHIWPLSNLIYNKKIEMLDGLDILVTAANSSLLSVHHGDDNIHSIYI